MREQTWVALFALVLAVSSVTQRAKAQATYIVFDVPGADCTNQEYPCASPVGINSQGTVVGYFLDHAGKTLGFYRLADGAISTFDVPGADCGNFSEFPCITPAAINSAGTIIGSFLDGGVAKGFLRDQKGAFTQFEVPNAYGTSPVAINSAGTVVGYYQVQTTNGLVAHGFLRDSEGNITLFDDPFANYGTQPSAVNSAGAVTGIYTVLTGSSAVVHGFQRSSDGRFTEITPPGGSSFIYPTAIDDAGRVAGYYFPPGREGTDTFFRDQLGNYTTFRVPGSVVTVPYAIDSNGTLMGIYEREMNKPYFGFYRLLDGSIGNFSPPGSLQTLPTAINDHGEITGTFFDAKSIGHGFIRVNH